MNLEELERPLGGGVGARLVSLDGSEGAQPDTTQPGRHVPVASAAADADTQRPDCADEAGESVASVHRAIRRYEHAGLAGVHIEDEIDPKGLGVGPPLLPITDLQARVETAVTPTAPTSSSSSSGRTSSRWTTVAHRLTRRHDPARRRWSGRRRGQRSSRPSPTSSSLLRSPPKSTFRLRVPVVDHRAAVRALRRLGVAAPAHAHCHIATHIFTRGNPATGLRRRLRPPDPDRSNRLRRRRQTMDRANGPADANSSAVSRDDPSEDQARVPTSAGSRTRLMGDFACGERIR